MQLPDGSREAVCLQKATRESMNDILCSVEEEGNMSDRTDSESGTVLTYNLDQLMYSQTLESQGTFSFLLC